MIDLKYFNPLKNFRKFKMIRWYENISLENTPILIETQNFSYINNSISFLHLDDVSILINLNLCTIMYSQREIAGENIKKYSKNYRKKILFLFHICVMKNFFSPLVSFWQFEWLQNMIDEKGLYFKKFFWIWMLFINLFQ